MSAKDLGWAINRKGIRPIEKLVLIMLADRADKDGWSFYAQETIAARCGCTRKTAREALKALADAGLIRRVSRSIGMLRTSDHIQIGPSSRWVKITQGVGKNLPTIPSTPYGVRVEEEKGAIQRRPSLKVIAGGAS